MRKLVVLLSLLASSLAMAKAQPEPLQPLDREKLLSLASLLRGAELALIESTDKGHIKQLTVVSLINAAPADVREIVAHPETYSQFVRNMVVSTVKPDADGTFVHQYKLSYKVYDVEGRHRYVMLPPEAGDAAPPVDMYDPDDNGRRHYRWQFLAAGAGTILVLYGFTVIPQDGFMKQYMDRAQTLELGLGLIPQLTLQLAVKERAEQLAHGKVVAATTGTPAFGFLLQRGTVALFRAIKGQLAEVTMLDNINASAEATLRVVNDVRRWKEFVPTISESYDLGNEKGVPMVEFEQSVPLLSWSTKWQVQATPSSYDMFAIDGDLRLSRMRWDVKPAFGGKTQLVLRASEGFEDTSIVLRSLYKLEPLFKYGINVGLGLVVLKGIESRATAASSTASK
jgi:ribosome-associated toxin RatA of RatAB toxin-antitoxin module